jgi:hypothetical protein
MIKLNSGARGIDQSALTVVKFPSGESHVWLIPDLGGERIEKEMFGIVAAFRDVRLYWSQGMEEGSGSPPDCVSNDFVHGHGKPGGACASCPMNQFGTARGKDGGLGRGKACAERRILFLLTPESLLPYVVSVPPTSVRIISNFFIQMAGQGIPYYGGVLGLGFEKDKNDDNVTYALLKPRMVQRLDRDQITQIRTIADSLKGAFARVDATVTQAAAAAPAGDAAGVGAAPSQPANDRPADKKARAGRSK